MPCENSPGTSRAFQIKEQLKLILFLVVLTVCSLSASGEDFPSGIAIRLDPAKATSLAAAAESNGMRLVAGDLSQIEARTRLVVLESSGALLAENDLQHLGGWVQHGGALLLTLSKSPGSLAFQLAFLSPTTSWQTQIGAASRGSTRGAVKAVQADEEFFPAGVPQGLTLPFHFEIRPWHAVERGEGRYERFAHTIPYINLAQRAGDSFWTRPLLNRDWQIRLRGGDVQQTPLLLTGRYGAGRVAVFASSAADLEPSPGAAALWNPTLQWLAQAGPPIHPAPEAKVVPEASIDRATRTLNVTLVNPTDAPLPLQVVARVLTWEQALVDNVSKAVVVPPRGKSSMSFHFPAAGLTGYQAAEFRDAYDVRLGVLSGDGAALLSETRLSADLRSPVTLAVATDNVRTMPYPFDAPAYNGQPSSFPFRMGLPTMVYAYPAGKKVGVTVTIANGLTNIAPLARLTDETDPSAYVAGLIDGAVNGLLRPGTDGFAADSLWRGVAGRENILSFAFPTPVRIAAVVLNGAPENVRKMLDNNPSGVVVELDGREVARSDNLRDRFVAEAGLVSLQFSPAMATTVRLRLKAPALPILGEVEIEGWAADLPPPAHGTLTVSLRDSFSDKTTPVAAKELNVAPGTAETVQYSVELPLNGGGAEFYRVEATFAGLTDGAPFLQIQPEHPLKPAAALWPTDASSLGFSVAAGFRTVFDLDTGARDAGGSGGRTPPDTLIWAYEHNMKQLAANAKTEIGRLYSSEGNTVYTTTPWRSFSDGEPFYDVATPIFIEKMKRESSWKKSDVALLNHGDRWDTGPAVDTLNGWQDYIGFDDYLRGKGQPGFKGKTRREISEEIHGQHESYWQEWNLERYAASIRTLHDAFAKEGKTIEIQGQGMPFVPPGYDKPPLTEVIRGQSQDSTWELADESVPYTTGFQMATKAFDPGWQLSTQFVWGYESAVLNNPMWHLAVGTTEPARRNLYDKAFRGAITSDGVYQSMTTYGYNMNAGVALTMNTNDWQETWRTQERNSLLTPDGPIGIGLVVGVERYNDPAHALFSGGGMGDDWGHNPARQQILALAGVLRHLQEAGLPIPFAANVPAVVKWGKTAPLIILNLDQLTDHEIEGLRALHERGAPLAALQGAGKLSNAAAALFGVNENGEPADGHKVGELNGRSVVAGAGTLFLPVAPQDMDAGTANTAASWLSETLQPPIRFPEGTSGYGFTSNRRAFVLVEDWREEGRVATLRYRPAARAVSVHAINVNDHRPLNVHRANAQWLVDVPLRPGDGVLVGIDETESPGN